MKPRKSSLNEAQLNWVRQWWRALQPREPGAAPVSRELYGFGRAERARLRRCAGIDELLAEPAMLTLADGLIRRDSAGSLRQDPVSFQHIAWIAGVLAWVSRDRRDGRTLASHLRAPPGSQRAVMSELRFRLLQRSVVPKELYLQWLRAVRLVDDSIDVAVLADDLLTWLMQCQQPLVRAAEDVRFRWAHDYYLDARAQAAAVSPVE